VRDRIEQIANSTRAGSKSQHQVNRSELPDEAVGQSLKPDLSSWVEIKAWGADGGPSILNLTRTGF
jgi:hypothetical protein